MPRHQVGGAVASGRWYRNHGGGAGTTEVVPTVLNNETTAKIRMMCTIEKIPTKCAVE